MNISLIKFEDIQENYQLLHQWCNQEFIYTWFEQRILSYEEIVNKYKGKLKENNQDLYIIKYNDVKIGLVQIYPYQDDTLKELKNYNTIYEYDLFIGNKEYIGKGLGITSVKLINNMIYSKYQADAIILRPFKKNKRAIKCYQKANYNIIHEYIDKDTIGNKEEIVILLNIN